MKIRFTLAILLGWLLLGPVAAAFAAAGDVPPRPVTQQGLTNLTALTRLIGYVRFFHPSDQAAGLANADWDALAMAGIERVEAARDPRELAAALSTLLPEIAPTVRVLPFPRSAGPAAGFSQDTGDGGAVRFSPGAMKASTFTCRSSPTRASAWKSAGRRLGRAPTWPKPSTSSG